MLTPCALGIALKPSLLYAYYAHPHLLLCVMQVGMMATSNTQVLLLPLLRPAQVLLAISCHFLSNTIAQCPVTI